MSKLSEKRRRLLNLISRYQKSGEFPLVREMARELGLAGESSLTRMLEALSEERYVSKHGGGTERRQRIYRLTSKGEAVVSGFNLRFPVLGAIPAGPLSEAVQQCDEFVEPGDALR